MGKRYGWFVALLVVLLVVAACGPQMATPTPVEEAAPGEALPSATVAKSAEATPTEVAAEPTEEAEPPADLPVAEGDGHILGSPDAAVTIVEYSDFQ